MEPQTAEAVIVTATQAVETARQLLYLSNQDRDKISGTELPGR